MLSTFSAPTQAHVLAKKNRSKLRALAKFAAATPAP
jgi:hypothetical protein